jgi:tetratricopeptide (TPR) repeat protein
MAEFTIGDRLILHLYTYRSVNPEDYFNIPWELTQDGISSSLGISRAHASIELKRQKEKGTITETLVRIKGGKVRRYAYSLNDKGLKTAMDLEDRVKAAGLDMRSLIDFKKQEPTQVLDSLSKGDRDALGIACTFRLSVPVSVLPEHARNVVPADVNGRTTITPELRNRILSAASGEELRGWHSYAADYYDKFGKDSAIEDGDSRAVEKVYHFIKAGRIRDANKTIGDNLYAILLSDDRGLFEAIRDAPDADIKPKYKLNFMIVRTELALSQNDLKTARESAEKLIETDGGEEYGFACLAECLMLRKKEDEAKEVISKINNSGNVLGMLRLAEIYVDLDEIDKAEEQFAAASKLVSDNNEAAVVQKYTVEARIDVARGRMEEGERHISKASASTDKVGKNSLRTLSKSLGLKIRDLTESDFS